MLTLLVIWGCTQIIIEQPQLPEGIPSSVEIKLSPTALNLFQECPTCFWLDRVKKIKRPEDPFPTFFKKMDKQIKEYFDKYRAQGKLPPELEGKVIGRPMPDKKKMNKWRNSGIGYKDHELNAKLFGKLDECLVDGNIYIVADYKTRGYPPKKQVPSYYQTQLDCYTLLLKENNYKTADFAYLIYYILEDVREGGTARFKIKPKKVAVDSESARKVFESAVEVLRSTPPKPDKNCKYCQWRKKP